MASFKGYKRSIKLEFDYDEVKAGIPNVSKQMAVLNAEFKKSSAEAVASGKEIDKLGTRYDFLSNKIKIQEQEVENYRKKLETATTAKGNNTKAIQNNTTSLEIAQAKLAQTKAELDKVTQELDKQKTTLGKTSEEWEKLGGKTTALGESMTTKLTLPILAAAAASFKLGADLEDALGKASAVFDKNAGQIESWAKGAYKNFGIAKTTALDMANSFGALASGMGLTERKTYDYSKALTELSVDMVAFHGGRLDVAETALNSIFTGETESLKKYGIVMTQANLQQFAHNEGIRKKISEMTEAEKVQLRYDFVMEKSQQVIGHYNKEQDNATTQLLKFKEGLKELGVSFSEQILPLFLPFIEGLNKIIEKFISLDAGTKKFIVTIAGVIAVAGPIILILGNLFGAISNISTGMKAAKGAIDIVSKAGSTFSGLLANTQFLGFAKWALIIAGVAAAIAFLINQINVLIGKGREANAAINNVGTMTNSLSGSVGNTAIRGYAVGTQYHPGGLAMVGEEGPELVNLPRGSQVYTNGETKGMLSGGDTYIIQVNMDEVDEVYKLTNVFKQFKQTKRAGVVNG